MCVVMPSWGLKLLFFLLFSQEHISPIAFTLQEHSSPTAEVDTEVKDVEKEDEESSFKASTPKVQYGRIIFSHGIPPWTPDLGSGHLFKYFLCMSIFK